GLRQFDRDGLGLLVLAGPLGLDGERLPVRRDALHRAVQRGRRPLARFLAREDQQLVGVLLVLLQPAGDVVSLLHLGSADADAVEEQPRLVADRDLCRLLILALGLPGGDDDQRLAGDAADFPVHVGFVDLLLLARLGRILRRLLVGLLIGFLV